jgi:hypothetical protein
MIHLMIRLLSVIAFIGTLASASPISIDYTLNMGGGGSNKTDVTSIAVFQSNGSQLDLSFVPSIPGTGSTLLSVLSPFQPSFSLIIGISEPADSTGRRHLIAFISESAATNNSGRRFSEIYAGYGERAFQPRLIAAAAGDATEQEWLKTFYTNAGYVSAFATGSVPVAVEYTLQTTIPEPATYSMAGLAILALVAARRKR